MATKDSDEVTLLKLDNTAKELENNRIKNLYAPVLDTVRLDMRVKAMNTAVDLTRITAGTVASVPTTAQTVYDWLVKDLPVKPA